jgi:peptide/nickel transport system substrate-binding protein
VAENPADRNPLHKFILDRRKLMQAAAAAAATAALPIQRGAAQEDLTQGGTLKVAIIGEPPAVADATFTTATITNNIAQQAFEGLFALDSAFNPQPLLVSEHTLSDDGLTFTFKLRTDVTFHDGSPLTAADVVASLNRWGAINGRGKLIYKRMASLTAVDNATVEMVFNQPSGVLPSFLARSEAMIIPAAIAEAAGDKQLTTDQLIGTGPFKFAAHEVDRFVRFERYDGYVSRTEEPDGLAGRRTAYLDAIEFIPVPDGSVRANGVLTGEYHFGETLPADFVDTLEADPSVEVLIVKPYYWYSPHFNKKQGPFTDVKMRKAVQLAFSQSEATLAGFGREEFVRFDPSVCGEETAWYSTAGTEAYDKPDPEQAKALLTEAGYAGETIRWITTHEYPYNYLIADYIKQQLEAIGMVIELVVSDWATLVERRADPTAYEIFLTGHSQYSHPATQPFNDPAWPGFWENPDNAALVDRMIAAATDEELKAAIDEWTTLIWTDMPFVKVGDNFVLRARRQEVQGYQNEPDWYFWNVGLSE